MNNLNEKQVLACFKNFGALAHSTQISLKKVDCLTPFSCEARGFSINFEAGKQYNLWLAHGSEKKYGMSVTMVAVPGLTGGGCIPSFVFGAYETCPSPDAVLIKDCVYKKIMRFDTGIGLVPHWQVKAEYVESFLKVNKGIVCDQVVPRVFFHQKKFHVGWIIINRGKIFGFLELGMEKVVKTSKLAVSSLIKVTDACCVAENGLCFPY